MSDTKRHPYRGLVLNLPWARVLASAAPHIASNKCEQAVTRLNSDGKRSSATKTAQDQEQQSLGADYGQQVRRMVNRLRSEEFKDKQMMTLPGNSLSEEYRIAAEAAAMHQSGCSAETTADGNRPQSVSIGLQQTSDSNSAGSLKAIISLDRQLNESRSVRAAANELLGHSIRYNMLQ